MAIYGQKSLKECQTSIKPSPYQTPDYLQSHFKSSTNTLRIIAGSVLVVFVVIYVASQMDVTGIAFESMLGIDYRIGVLVDFSIVLVYIFIGGFV